MSFNEYLSIFGRLKNQHLHDIENIINNKRLNKNDKINFIKSSFMYTYNILLLKLKNTLKYKNLRKDKIIHFSLNNNMNNNYINNNNIFNINNNNMNNNNINNNNMNNNINNMNNNNMNNNNMNIDNFNNNNIFNMINNNVNNDNNMINNNMNNINMSNNNLINNNMINNNVNDNNINDVNMNVDNFNNNNINFINNDNLNNNNMFNNININDMNNNDLGNNNNMVNNNMDNNIINKRKRYYILRIDALFKLKQIHSYLKGLNEIKNITCTKEFLPGNNIFWLLAEFNDRYKLKNEYVFFSIYNFSSHHYNDYSNFVNSKGPKINLNAI